MKPRNRATLALLLLFAACAPVQSPSSADADLARYEQRAQDVTIVRDDWGIPHITGRTDADVVFGLSYAQAEDDFNRVETNFINAMGRLAEAEGESAIYRDLRMKLFIDPDTLRTLYGESPPWLRELMDAWADGLNYYLATHPEVTPRVIERFEPWMALSFSEGSIGGDIERVSLSGLEELYGDGTAEVPAASTPAAERSIHFPEPRGSNGIAISPRNTADGNALLLINPHTSFFFRAEVQVTSGEGLNAYGAVTWGQFFVYQGFNERVGWMHTSSGVDVVDEFLETVVERDGRLYYVYGDEERPVLTSTITIPYRAADGEMASRTFTVHKTHRGPVVREEDGRWVSVALMNTPIEALSQSFLRTKALDYDSFREVAELKANSSNATVYADADGTIAYFHPQFVPIRDDRFDYTRPVDGSDPATDWQGLHALADAPHVRDPAGGWIQNTNNWAYSAAGEESPRQESFPRYMDSARENARGLHAIMLLEGRTGFTLSSLQSAAYDSYLTAFARLVPSLLEAHDGRPAGDPLRAEVADEIDALRGWDYRWSTASVPTSLAVFWGEELMGMVGADARGAGVPVLDYMATRATPEQKLRALAAASARLQRDFGSWSTPWGEINRFQRLTGDIDHPFSDAAPSIPVGFTSGTWGSLASFGARPRDGSKRYYGTSGNSFVAVVEFGDSVRARAVTAGGQSGDPASPHFNDQAERYSTGDLREVYFYPSQLQGHTEREYHPGG